MRHVAAGELAGALFAQTTALRLRGAALLVETDGLKLIDPA
jgi:hypothetical protein